MPTFSLTTHTDGPVEEVWKPLHDPSRFPEWWEGVETVEVDATWAGAADYTMWPGGYPDFPMDQRLEEAPGRVTISCLVSDLMFVWRLREAGHGTDIDALMSASQAARVPATRCRWDNVVLLIHQVHQIHRVVCPGELRRATLARSAAAR